MGGRPFVGFDVDIGIGDDLIEPTDRIKGEGWFDFAGLPRPEFRMISREQQFAEKRHAYTRSRTDRDNSRVKDLVDLLLLVRTQIEPLRLRDNRADVRTPGDPSDADELGAASRIVAAAVRRTSGAVRH
jgi:hypothetical protein